MAAPATTPSKQAFILIDIAGQQRRIEISRSPFTIGRSEEADATISDSRVSRLHAKIVFEGDAYSIQDSGSRRHEHVRKWHALRTRRS